MKLHFSALLASIAAANSVSAERDLQAIGNGSDAASVLYQRWFQDVPAIGYDAATNVFTLDFTTSSHENTDDNMDAVFYDEGCRWDGETTGFVEYPVLPPLIHKVGVTTDHALAVMVGTGTTAAPQLQFQLDPGLLAKEPKIYTVGTDGKATMKICVRTSLGYDAATQDANGNPLTAAQIAQKNTAGGYIRQADPLFAANVLQDVDAKKYQEVNFIESLISINYDLSAGFDVDSFAVEPKLRVETTAIKANVYKLRAYLCQLFNGEIEMDEAGATNGYGVSMPVDLTADFVADPTGSVTGGEGGKGPQKNAKAFNQGSLITVCVLPDTTAYGEGIRMNGLTTFDWARPTPVNTQEAIVGSAPSGNLLTSYIHNDCTGGKDYCKFSSVLFADFYRSKGTAAGSGTAVIQFEARRRLGEKEVRMLQEDETASEFGIEVELDVTDEGPGALKTAGGASFGFTVMASVIALASAALLA